MRSSASGIAVVIAGVGVLAVGSCAPSETRRDPRPPSSGGRADARLPERPLPPVTDAGSMPDVAPALVPPPEADAAPAPMPPPEADAAPDTAPAPPTPPPPTEPPPRVPAAVCGTGPSRLGPPTNGELAMVSRKIKENPPIPEGTNQGNNLAYGNAAKLAGQMRTMYGLTGDRYFLDQAIRFSDHMLAARNHPETGRVIWTGKREPCWPNKAMTAGDAAYCGAENGLVVSQLIGPAKIIFEQPALWDQPVGIPDPHGFGRTYLERARSYLREGRRTMDQFLLPNYVQPSKSHHLHIPTHPGFAALTPGNYAKDQGHALPWNQQDMVVGAVATLSEILVLLKEDPAAVTLYEAIARSALDWFISDLQSPSGSYQVGGVAVYKWGYAPGNFRNIENLAHASADINMLYQGYRRGRFGIARTVMLPMANTFFEVIAKPDGSYASEVDGSGMRASVSGAWMNYEEFRSGIVARLLPKLTIDESTPEADAVSILSVRKRLCP